MRASEGVGVVEDWVAAWFGETIAGWSGPLLIATIVVLAYFVARRLMMPLAEGAAKRSRTRWDDVMVKHHVVARLVPIAPLLAAGRGVALIDGLNPQTVRFLERLAMALIVMVVARVFGALLSAVNEIYSGFAISQGRPIKGYLQVLKIVVYGAAGIVLVAALLDQSPWFFLSGLGAMTAVLLLIFRDTLLSFVAGIQLTSNDLIRVGDWIEMPQFNADGDVVDISLNVVKVQNWDSTVTVIPTHKFLEHSFKNWRSMFEAGGRRIKRALRVDVTSVRFLTTADVERLSRLVLLKDYLATKLAEVREYNKSAVPTEFADILANGRHLTNIGTFRAYIVSYLRQHPGIHQGKILMIRQLDSTPEGLPLEIYAFSSDTGWIAYETLQADIFDHLFAVAPEFGLRVFQAPAGSDIGRLKVD